MAREFIVPGQMISGSGALDMAQDTLGTLGKKAMIVTDKVMIDLGNCAKVENALKSQGVEYTIYSEIAGEPTDVMIEKGLAQYKAERCDFLVALGGGSPIDSMKAIGSLVKNGGSISDYMGKVIDVEMPPMVAIPTTAGTGSEATQFTIITDTRKDIKMLLKGKVLIPSLAIIDPQFTMTAPPKITAATGLDALCHAVEAYTSRKAQIGALFHVAHGLSNAMLMKECLSFALEGAYDRFADLGRAIGVATPEDSDQAASEKFLDAVVALTEELETPTLAEFGIDKEKFFEVIEKMAYDAMDSGSPQNTQRTITQADVEQMYKNLW